jgi:hypothetical protein
LRLDEALGQIGLPGKNQISRLPPEPYKHTECSRQPRAGCKKRTNDLVSQPIARKSRKREGQERDTGPSEQPR